MSWKLVRWCLQREPVVSDSRLMPATNLDSSVDFQGNRYLYSGIDSASFSILTIPRSLIWLLVAAAVLAVALSARSIPSAQHPIVAVFVALGLGGLLVLAPDAAVMAGQVSLVSLVLVVVMLTVRSLIQGEVVLLPPNALGNQATRHVPVPDNAESAGTGIVGTSANEGESGITGTTGRGDSGGPANTLTTTSLGQTPGGSSRAQARGF